VKDPQTPENAAPQVVSRETIAARGYGFRVSLPSGRGEGRGAIAPALAPFGGLKVRAWIPAFAGMTIKSGMTVR